MLLWNYRRDAIGAEADRAATVSPPLGSTALNTHAGQQTLFDIYEIPRAPSILVHDLADARRAARELAYPVAAKLAANELGHKSEMGGVCLNISTESQLDRDFVTLDAIPVQAKQGILIQKMVRGDYELFAGTKRDDTFGPVVVFGLGGIYVEILKDSVMQLAPFSEKQAMQLIEGARFFPILAGARGKQPMNLDAIARILSRLSIMAAEQPAVQTIDLNPIMATSGGAVVVDAKITTA